MIRLFKNIKYLLIRASGNSAALYYLLRMIPSAEELLVVKDTELCIEGYPRSANSFLTLFFSHFNPGVKTAHHLHLPLQIKVAAKYNIPTIVVLRHPSDAITSLLIRENYLYTWVATKTYIWFYQMIKKKSENIIVASFEVAINNPETIIDHVNEKFKRSFNRDGLTDEINDHLFGMIDYVNQINGKEETAISRPSAVKDNLKRDILYKVTRHRLYQEALDTYKEFNSSL